jgi:hypothetical protein
MIANGFEDFSVSKIMTAFGLRFYGADGYSGQAVNENFPADPTLRPEKLVERVRWFACQLCVEYEPSKPQGSSHLLSHLIWDCIKSAFRSCNIRQPEDQILNGIKRLIGFRRKR